MSRDFRVQKKMHLSGQKLDLGIGIVGLHQPSGMDLDPLQVDALSTDGLRGLIGR